MHPRRHMLCLGWQQLIKIESMAASVVKAHVASEVQAGIQQTPCYGQTPSARSG